MLGFNKYTIMAIVAAVMIALGTVAIFKWRDDIMQVAYDKIFRKMAEQELKKKDDEIDRLKSLADARQNAVTNALKERDVARLREGALKDLINGQTYSKEPVSPGLTRSLDAIQDYGRPTPTQNSPTTGGDKK